MFHCIFMGKGGKFMCIISKPNQAFKNLMFVKGFCEEIFENIFSQKIRKSLKFFMEPRKFLSTERSCSCIEEKQLLLRNIDRCLSSRKLSVVFFFVHRAGLNLRLFKGRSKIMSSSNQQASIPSGMKFVFGGSAGMGATVFVQPLDLVKNRMQVTKIEVGGQRPTSMSVLANVVKNEGFFTLYNGLSAGLLRQATYTTTRLGIYTFLFEKFSNPDGTPPNFLTKAALGMTAGATGAFVGTPAEVALIRMTSDGNLPADQRRNYKSVFDAIVRIFKEEGLFTLWRGAIPTMGRAMVVNAAQLASYSQAKQFIIQTGEIFCSICLNSGVSFTFLKISQK